MRLLLEWISLAPGPPSSQVPSPRIPRARSGLSPVGHRLSRTRTISERSTVDGAHPVTGRHVALQAELSEQCPWRQPPFAHHPAALRPRTTESGRHPAGPVVHISTSAGLKEPHRAACEIPRIARGDRLELRSVRQRALPVSRLARVCLSEFPLPGGHPMSGVGAMQ